MRAGAGETPQDSEAEEAHEIMGQVVSILEMLLERRSRWTGSVELTDNLFSSGIAHLDGRIEITRAVWRQPEYRWRTVIHEALHLCSPAYTKYEYSLSRGWEEGVVEQMQRMLRQEVLQRLGVVMPEAAFAERDAAHEYNGYLQALESLRQPLKLTELDFYRWLMAVPLPDRLRAVKQAGDSLPDSQTVGFRYVLMLAQAKLGRL